MLLHDARQQITEACFRLSDDGPGATRRHLLERSALS